MLMRLQRRADFNVQAPDDRAQRIGRAAIAALYDELALAPKPGLVSFVDSGSHSDMNATTFMRSLFALRHYFPRIAMLGATGAPFEALESLGMAAEARMLQATGGINTHRGAVFTLGLICAAAGSRQRLMDRWGEALQARRHRTSAASVASNGQHAARALGLRSAGEEAAMGLPIVFDCAVPALAEARRQGFSDQRARLQTLFHIMVQLDDTNLAHRGGLAGLRFAQSQAREFLDAGGAARPDALTHAQRIHQAFIARRLSPGGAADVLAAAGLIERLGQQSS
ncbi:MAG: triphosphoribosyl-dephospho-CoA synthase [Microbacteriaceae bacterium]|nr:triphosphoribosyl-dephospho-CoA synthase [Burkholderiaceae bacterium]